MEEPKQKKPFHEQRVLWPLVTGYSLIYLGLMILDFVLRDKFTMPPGMMVIYIALLTAYAGDKEIRRWFGSSLPAKWGSVFVYAWFIFFAGAYITQTINSTFELPADLSKVCLQVLGIFFGSKVSSKIYIMKQDAKDFNVEFIGREDRVMSLLEEVGEIQTKTIAKFLNVSARTASRILQQMEEGGKIVQKGSGRGTYYVSS